MRLTIAFLGLDLLDPCIETAPATVEHDEPGDCLTTPFGFTADFGDARWEKCADYGYGDE